MEPPSRGVLEAGTDDDGGGCETELETGTRSRAAGNQDGENPRARRVQSANVCALMRASRPDCGSASESLAMAAISKERAQKRSAPSHAEEKETAESDQDEQSQLKRAKAAGTAPNHRLPPFSHQDRPTIPTPCLPLATGVKKRGRMRKTPGDRMKAWPGEYLHLLGEQMICEACNKPIGGRKKAIDVTHDDIKKHVNSEVHTKRKKMMKASSPAKRKTLQTLRSVLEKANEGSKLNDATISHRYAKQSHLTNAA